MGQHTWLANCVMIILFALTLTSCSKDLTPDSELSTDPFLYVAKELSAPQKIGQMILYPQHRKGPNGLNSGNFSTLPVSVWIPEGATSPYPVVIYSHGGGSRTTPGESGENWGEELSRNGYAVIAMHHMARSSQDVIRNICNPMGISSMFCDPNVFIPYYESTDRPKDAVTVMDSLEKIGEHFGVKFDKQKIAILGYSGGTNTTHYLSGGTRNATYGFSEDEYFFSKIDSRPKCFLAMSSGAGIEGGWTKESLESIQVPFFCTTGLGDLSGEIRAAFYDQMKFENQYRLFINSESAGHGVYNLSIEGNAEEKALQEIFHSWLISSSIAFLDGHVKNDQEALDWLRSENLQHFIAHELPENEVFPSWSYR